MNRGGFLFGLPDTVRRAFIEVMRLLNSRTIKRDTVTGTPLNGWTGTVTQERVGMTVIVEVDVDGSAKTDIQFGITAFNVLGIVVPPASITVGGRGELTSASSGAVTDRFVYLADV